MSTQKHELVRFLELLGELGCLEHVMVVGSWAECIYGQVGLFDGFEPNIKTMDIDFLVKNLRRPVPEIKVASEARKRGYIVEADRVTGVTKLFSIEGLEIEFLIGKIGAGLEASLKTNLGVTAQSLRHLDILSRNAMEVTFEGLEVCVPSPEAYALHKMIINHERGKKREKDERAIVGIWPYLDRSRLTDVARGLSKKERSRVSEFLKANGLCTDFGLYDT